MKSPALIACLASDDDDGAGRDQAMLRALRDTARKPLNIRLCRSGEHDWFTGRYRIMGTPPFLFFDEGRELRRLLGRTDVQGLLDFIDQEYKRRQ